MRINPSQLRRAFTLVELLVVIGIIAVLIGILLPVLASINERGRDVKCQSNLRSIMQAVFGYAAENDGSMPWGIVFDHNEPIHWDPAPEFNGEHYSWASLIAHYMDPRVSAAWRNTDWEFADKRHIYAGVMLCPEAAQVRQHYVSYAMNILVAVTPRLELMIGEADKGALTKTTKQTLLLKDTAVLWDTTFTYGFERSVVRLGVNVDNVRIGQGAFIPQWRYYQVKDSYAHVTPGTYSQNRPAILDAGSFRYYNYDPGPLPHAAFANDGNLRFRHRKNTTCNVAFADGSVRQFTGKFKRDGSLQNQNPLNLSHDALRRYFMINWPSGVHPNRGYPH